jgi:DNA-binding NtrC family response regulator
MAQTDAPKNILIFTADAALLSETGDKLCLQGYRIHHADQQRTALSLFDKMPVAVAFVDLETDGAQEFDFVNYIKSRSPQTEVIVLTSIDRLEEATSALRKGASFYLIKPITCDDIRPVIEKLSVRVERSHQQQEMEHRFLFDLMGSNPSMQKALKLAIKIAPTTSTVLIGGESGTGKEFFARIVHRMSQRGEGAFIAVNCGAIPETLVESELFGHRKGAFTGADRDKPGLVEEAHLGTLFLDEVGELSAAAQVKLLRFLQERSFRRVGETVMRSVNTRVIAASNKNLASMVQEGTFREDLYYRINVFYLHLPPLRERKDTIPNLVRLFVHKNNTLFGKKVNKISKTAEAILANYAYPGNVRELENIIEHAVVLTDGDEITEKELPEFMYRGRPLLSAPPAGAEADELLTLEELERRHIAAALEKLNYNYTETAKKLGVSRSTLWRKIKAYGLEPREE